MTTTTDNYKTFLTDNKDKLDKTQLSALSEDKWAMKQFIDSGNIDQKYFQSTTASPTLDVETASVPTADISTDVTQPEPPKDTQEAIEGSIQTTQDAIDNAPIESQERLIEEAAQKDAATLQAEEFAQKNADIITTQEENIAATQNQIDDLANTRAFRDANALTRKKNAEIEKAELAVEEQRLTNKMAIETAEIKVETAKQQASWAFNKLWLGFSSGIINEVQRIATRGASEIAKVKVQGAKFLADTQIKVADLELKYTKEINFTIDKYTDIAIQNKQNIIKRIADTQNNLLLSNKQKEDAINKIKGEYKTSTRGIEDDLKTEQERLSDKMVQQTAALEQQVKAGQNQQKTVINRQFENGNWFNLTDGQKGEQLLKAGLSLQEWKAMENTMFGKAITNEVSGAVWTNVTLTGTDRSSIQTLSKEYMEGGLIFSEATKRATLDYIDSDPRLSRVKKVQDAKLKKALAPRSGGSSTVKWKPQTKINEKGEFISVDPVTNISAPILDAAWNPVLAQQKEATSLQDTLNLLDAL